MSQISIVCPVFNEVENVPIFILKVKQNLTDYPDFEIIFAVDPSNDGTEELIKQENSRDARIKMIRFSRRFGQAAATLAGIEFSSGDAVIVMDVDLQDPPEVIPRLIQKWQEGHKIVLATREKRIGDPWLKKVVARGAYKFLNKFSEVPIPENTGDFRLMDREVVSQLKKFKESNSFLKGLVALIGYEPYIVYFDRVPRLKGETKYNKIGSSKSAFNGVIGFSTVLLKFSTFAGLFFSFLAIAIAILYAFAKVTGIYFPLGNPTIVISILVMGGLNLLSIGILGLYLSRIYEEVKQRPKYIAQEIVGLQDR